MKRGPLSIFPTANLMFWSSFLWVYPSLLFCSFFQDLKQVQLKQRPSAFRPWSPKAAEKEKPATQNEVERWVIWGAAIVSVLNISYLLNQPMKCFKCTCIATTGPTQIVMRLWWLPIWHQLPWPLLSIPGTATLLAGGSQPFPGRRMICIMETHNLQQNRPPPVPPTDPTTWTQMARLMWMTVMMVSTTHHLRVWNNPEKTIEHYKSQFLQLQLELHIKPNWK